MNIAELIIKLADLVAEPFDQSEFIFDFIQIFDPPKATLTRMRKAAIEQPCPGKDLFWPRKLKFRAAEFGKAASVVDFLKTEKVAKSKTPRFVISTDGNEFSAFDTKIDEAMHCDFDKVDEHIDFFLPLVGIDKYEAAAENPADIKAVGRLSKLYDEIIRTNPDWITSEKRHALNQFITRLLFCMFAEDTGAFKKNLFIKTITEFGGEHGEHLQELLGQIFDVMNVPEAARSKLPIHINAFPYVNGGLFVERTEVPELSKRIKRVMIEAAQLKWQEINPDIFGSMIQGVVDDKMRGDLGMHYTSVPNILKVLQPLFLLSLEEDFESARDHREERSMLKKLLVRLSKIRVFDPACGSGNFLIIAYSELRKLEMRVFERLDKISGGTTTWREGSGVKLSNFYGIELADFAAETAKLSLWIAEYQMNQRFKETFGEAPKPFPLKDGGHIVQGNALQIDWRDVCPHENSNNDETYIVGNPPYIGRRNQTKSQKAEKETVFSAVDGAIKGLDFVAAWFYLAAQYISNTKFQAAFVSTNSLFQGEQVATFWPAMSLLNVKIFFVHESFKWANNAAKNAGVTCVIVGIESGAARALKIYSGYHSRRVDNINAYLIDGPTTIIKKRSSAISSLPRMRYGNMPADGNHLTISPEEKNQIVASYPEAVAFFKKLLGGKEFISGIERWCLWISDDLESIALEIPPIAERINATKQVRVDSIDPSYNRLADKPHQFREMHCAREHAIVVPTVSSERRKFITCGIIDASYTTNNQLFVIFDSDIFVFSILSSTMHSLWVRAACGQLETRIRYSSTLAYNTFPIPPLTDEQKLALESHAWEIIGARDAHPGKTIAWLYNPKTMPNNLLVAHQALDDTLEKIYIGRAFKSDTERLEHLFKLYSEMIDHKGT